MLLFIPLIRISLSSLFKTDTGHTDFETGFRTLHHAGYNGTMAFEYRVPGEDAATAYAASLHYIKNLRDQIWT